MIEFDENFLLPKYSKSGISYHLKDGECSPSPKSKLIEIDPYKYADDPGYELTRNIVQEIEGIVERNKIKIEPISNEGGNGTFAHSLEALLIDNGKIQK